MSIHGDFDHQLGEMPFGWQIGFKNGSRYIWQACAICGKERWVQFRVKIGKPERTICMSCGKRGRRNVRWKGGKFITSSGYVMILLEPDNFFYSMCRPSHYILEHRLVMAQQLKRCLLSWEIVHHKNGIRSDNRLENLQLLSSQAKHFPSIKIKQELQRQANVIVELQARVTILEGENTLLRKQVIKEGECEYSR